MGKAADKHPVAVDRPVAGMDILLAALVADPDMAPQAGVEATVQHSAREIALAWGGEEAEEA